MATMATVSQWRQRHAISLSNGLRDLFTQKKLCDVTIQCRERTARAHKVILAACSTVLSGRLLGLDNGAEDTINLDDVIESADAEQSVACVMSLLEFVYTGALCVNDANRQQLLLLADALGMDSAVTYINQGLNSPVEESETKTVCLQTGESSLQTDVSLELSESVDVQSGSGVSRHDDPPGPREGDRRRARRPPLTLAIDVSSQTEPEAVDVNCDVIRPERMTVSTQTDSSSLKGQEAAGEIGIEVAVQTASTPLVLDSIRKDLNNHDYPDQNLGLLEIKQEIFATTEVNVLTRLKRRLRPSYKEVSDLEDTDRDDNDLWPEMENVAVPGDDGEKSTTQASRKISTSKAPAIKRKRGRPRKTAEVASDVAVPIKRKRGRPRKNPLPVKHPRLDEAAGDSNKEEGGQDADASAVDHSAQNESAPAVTTEPGDKRSPIERRSARAKAAGRPGRYSSQWKRNADGEYVCLVCGVAKRTSTSVVSHIMGHTGDRPYHCTHCPKRFKTKAKMTDHVRVHTGEKPYSCVICNRHFRTRKALKKHEPVHTETRQFQCEECGRRFSRTDNLRNHVDAVHLGRKRRELACTHPGCDYVTGDAKSLRFHKVSHGGDVPNDLMAICDECGKSVRKSSLSMHMLQHREKEHRCGQCSYRTQFPNALASHMMRLHGTAPDGSATERPFQCHVCPESYFTKQELNLHLMRHAGQKPHKCPVCDFATVDKGSMKMHVRTHTGETPYECKLCSKAFKQSSTLYSHVRTIHRGEKPYRCAECGRAYVNKKDLVAHRFARHLNVKPFQCGFCRYACTKREYLSQHITKEHGADQLPAELRCKRRANKRLTPEELAQLSPEELAQYSEKTAEELAASCGAPGSQGDAHPGTLTAAAVVMGTAAAVVMETAAVTAATSSSSSGGGEKSIMERPLEQYSGLPRQPQYPQPPLLHVLQPQPAEYPVEYHPAEYPAIQRQIEPERQGVAQDMTSSLGRDAESGRLVQQEIPTDPMERPPLHALGYLLLPNHTQ